MSDALPPMEVPRFSLAEREQRWRRVRQLMARDGLDVLVAPPNTGHWDHFQANVRYLTGLGGNCAEVAAVFPLQGEVTAVTISVPSKAQWLALQDWVTDIRDCDRYFGRGMVERLRELGVQRERIGVAGLANVTRFPDGVISYGTMRELQTAFPHAEFVDATFLLEEAKYVKSAEELAMLERATELVEQAIEVMAREARPGVPECVVYGRMIASMVEAGGELPTMLLWATGPATRGNMFQPTQRQLAVGDVITNEVEARWAGYVAQGVQPVAIGKMPAVWREMFAVQQRALDRCYELLRPGSTVGDLLDVSERAAEGTPFVCRLIVHGRGLGDDMPIAIYGTQDPKMRNWPIENDAVFIVKPAVSTSDRTWSLNWGDTVVATPTGARRMGKRPREILTVG